MLDPSVRSPYCHPSLTCMLTGKDQARRWLLEQVRLKDVTERRTEHSCRHPRDAQYMSSAPFFFLKAQRVLLSVSLNESWVGHFPYGFLP